MLFLNRFDKNNRELCAPLIVSVQQFLLQHQVDNEGLPGQGLAPGVPTF